MAEIILNKIQIKRGLKANLPTLDIGEPAYCTDTKQFFIGTSTGNELINGGFFSSDIDGGDFTDLSTTDTIDGGVF